MMKNETLDKLVVNLADLAYGRGNAPKIISSGFYVLDVTREYTKCGTSLKVSAQGSIKDMPFELADAIVSEGYANRHNSDDNIFYPINRVLGGVIITVVGVNDNEKDESVILEKDEALLLTMAMG